MKKSDISLILIFLFAAMPFLFVAYENYLIEMSDLSLWDVKQAKRAGEFDTILSPVWTVLATFLGVLIWLPAGARYVLRRDTIIIVFAFALFLVLMLVSTIGAPEQLLTTSGQIFRYIDYFLIAPFALLLAGRRLGVIYFPLLIALITLSLAIVVPNWDQIRWSEITYARDTVGKGGSASAIGGAYLAVFCGVFLIYDVHTKSKFFLARRSLELTLAGISLLIMVLAFSRGALLAVFLMLFTYSGLRSSRSLQSMSIHLFWLLFFITSTAIFLSDEMAMAFSRQGQLEGGVDAGRFDLWRAWFDEATSSLTNFFFGSDTGALDAPAHNMWLGILTHYGFFALLAYAVFHFAALSLLLRKARNETVPSERDFAQRAFAASVAILFFANLENTFFLNVSPMGYLYYFLVGLFVYKQFRIKPSKY